MAVLQRIREFFIPPQVVEPEIVVPAPPTAYEIRTLTDKQIKELLRISLRCFKNGENYTKYTYAYLLGLPNGLSYRIVTAKGEMVGFIFVAINANGFGHITTVGVAPEHRQRGLAARLLRHAEDALRKREVSTVVLEVRVGNVAAQNLYLNCGYAITQRVSGYYTNGEDSFIMVKAL